MSIKHIHTLPECRTEPINGTEKLWVTMPTLQQIQLSDSCYKTPTAKDEYVALPPIKKHTHLLHTTSQSSVQPEAFKSG